MFFVSIYAGVPLSEPVAWEYIKPPEVLSIQGIFPFSKTPPNITKYLKITHPSRQEAMKAQFT